MFEIQEFTESRLATLTPRSQKHGDEDVPAVSLGIEIETGNAILDCIDPKLRPTFYTKPEGQDTLPGVDEVLTVLRCNSIDRVTLPTKHEGWSLQVDDGIDDTEPMLFGSCKVDKFSVEPKQGGTIVLRLRVGTSDLDAEKSGMLGMHVGQSIWIKLIAPRPGADAEKSADTSPADADATDLFTEPTHEERLAEAAAELEALDPAGGDEQEADGAGAVVDAEFAEVGEQQRGESWPFPKADDASQEAPPQSVTVEKPARSRRSKAATQALTDAITD